VSKGTRSRTADQDPKGSARTVAPQFSAQRMVVIEYRTRLYAPAAEALIGGSALYRVTYRCRDAFPRWASDSDRPIRGNASVFAILSIEGRRRRPLAVRQTLVFATARTFLCRARPKVSLWKIRRFAHEEVLSNLARMTEKRPPISLQRGFHLFLPSLPSPLLRPTRGFS